MFIDILLYLSLYFRTQKIPLFSAIKTLETVCDVTFET